METPNKTLFTLGEASMHFALNQVGVHEQPLGSNWGPDVERYLISVGVDFPASWCMAFVYYCVLQTSMQNDKYGKMPLFRSPHVLTVWKKMHFTQKVIPIKAKPGDIFIMDFGNGAGHTGFVTDINHDQGKVFTVEGNSNLDGSREGKQVCRKPNGRLMSSLLGLIRL